MQKRSLRWSEHACVLEGPDLITAALDASAEFEALYFDQDAFVRGEMNDLRERAVGCGVRVFLLAPGVLERVANASTPQPVLGAVRMPSTKLEDLVNVELVLVLHDLRDPGNAGTLMRSAEAAGASGVVFTGQSVDPFNPKTLRASAGSIFHLPVALATLEDCLQYFSSQGVASYATVVRGGVSHRAVDFSRPSLVVIGNEATGLEPTALVQCETAMSIDMAGRSESLNAAVAGSLIAFEALWQRQRTRSSTPPPSL